MKICPVCSQEYPDEIKFCSKDGQALKPKGVTSDLVGHVIAERFDVQKKLGEGGMGQVYLAEHVKMGRPCAIKVLMPNMVDDPDAISRFNREASNASRINHPNVCQIYDFGETDDGLIYLAMEFIEGEPLGDMIEREGAIPPGRAVDIAMQVADALQSAHDLGIVHRDLKPDNIMVTKGREGRDMVKVVDFGIAKAFGADDEGQQVTKTGFVIGTPEYMSPEQLSGDKIDGRSDIYSLGLVAYRMLTGQLPFNAATAQEVMVARLTDKPIPLETRRPDLTFPAGLNNALGRALARRAVDRYQHASDFTAALRDMAGASTVQIPKTQADEAATQLLDAAAAQAAPATVVDAAPTALMPQTEVAPAPAKAPPARPPSRKKKAPLIVAAAVVTALVGGWVLLFTPWVIDLRPDAGAAGLDSTALAANTAVPTQGTPENEGGQPGDAGTGGQQNASLNAGENVDLPREGSTTGGGSTPSDPIERDPQPVDSGVVPLSGGVPEDINISISAVLDTLEPAVLDGFDRIEGTRAYRRAQNAFSNPNVSAQNRARIAFLIAYGWVERRQYDSARTWLQRGATLDPTNEAIQNMLQTLQ